MKILEMTICGYRNLQKSIIKFSPGVNFIYGKNAQGKTNLIEAVWMFTGARSFRGTKDEYLVSFNEGSARLEGTFFFEKRKQEISIFFSQGKRKAFLNGVPKPYPTNLIGKFRVVLFSPVHLSLISGGAEGRRRFLDAAICQLKPTYTALISGYNQTLKQRNAFLKSITLGEGTELLDVWNEKLATLGSRIVLERLDYLDFLKKEAAEIYFEISRGTENLQINYVSGFSKNISAKTTVEEIKEDIKSKLKKSQSSDIKLGFTSSGPHKDELELFVDGYRVKQFGSQGQQRSAALCLKLAEATVLEKKIGEPPVILLDDVMSELDDYRKNYVLNKIINKQIFITNCDSVISQRLKNGKLFRMENGLLSEEGIF